MNNLVQLVVGPLAGPECRRAVGRRWLPLVRTLAGLPAAAVVAFAVWAWWFYSQIVPGFKPSELLIGALVTTEGILIAIALVLSPALVSGALTKEKTQGMLDLLLGTSVSSYEIVVGRFAGALSTVAMFLLAGLPGLIFMAGLCGLGWWQLAWLVALPPAVAFGAGGLGIALSAAAHRGRDALMAADVLILMLLMSPLIGAFLSPASPWRLFAFHRQRHISHGRRAGNLAGHRIGDGHNKRNVSPALLYRFSGQMIDHGMHRDNNIRHFILDELA